MSPSPHHSSHNLNSGSKESLLKAIITEEGRQDVVSLRGDGAEVALTLMQNELDASGDHHNTKFRTTLSRVMLYLVDSSHRVPATLWLSNILEGEEVARGAYGVVHKGSWNGNTVALKFPYASAKDDLKKIFREVFIWRQFEHKNVLSFLGLYGDRPDNLRAMVAPWQSGGNVVDFIKNHPEEDRHRLLIQATNGLTYLHELEPPIVHSDLKPENILVSHEKTAMLADFGLSRMQHHGDLTELVSSDHFGVQGTLPYCAPELFKDTPSLCKPTTSRDIWALGMVIYRLFTGEVPFAEHIYPKGTCDAITSGARPKPRKYRDKQRGFTDELWNFLENDCWKMSKEERPSARYCRERLKELRSRWKVEKAAKLASPSRGPVEEIIKVSQSYRLTLFNRRKPYLQSLIEQFGVHINIDGTYGEIKILGDKISVEAAKKDIIGDYSNFTAPETTTSLSVPDRLKGAIIGEAGISVKALQKEYSVKIRVDQVSEQVTIKGPPDNVEKAKARLQSKVEYLQLYNDIWELPVSQKLITRLRSPRYQQEIKEKLGLRELRPSRMDPSITMRGPKAALEKAKAHFDHLQEEIDNETTLTLKEDIDQLSRLVRGETWPDIMRKCDGPSDPTLQRALVTLRQEENEVILTGEGALIQRLSVQLKLEVERRREIVLGMAIPHEFHRDLLREHDISEIRKTARVFISFPDGGDYDTLPDPQNLLDDDLTQVDESDIVKIQGTLESCTTARQMLKERVEEEEQLRRNASFKAKYHFEVRGNTMHKLKGMGIRVDFDSSPPRPPSQFISLSPLPQTPSILWGQTRRFDLTDEEYCTLRLRGRDKELGDALKILEQAVKDVSAASYEGRLKFPTHTKFGHLIGYDGENIRRLQTETNTKIIVADANDREHPCTIKIIGSKKDTERARDKILRHLESRWKKVDNVTSERFLCRA